MIYVLDEDRIVDVITVLLAQKRPFRMGSVTCDANQI
jgi:hypothetical protein